MLRCVVVCLSYMDLLLVDCLILVNCLILIDSLVSCAMLAVWYVLVVLSCVLSIVIFLFTTLDTIGKELEVRSEPEEHQDKDQGHIAEPGKPPHHSNEILLFLQACFVFKNKIMHVLILSWPSCHPRTILQSMFCFQK